MFKIGFAAILLVSSVVFAAATDPDALVRSADEHRTISGPHSLQVKVTVFEGSDTQEQTYAVKVRDQDTSLVEQIAPARAKGRKLLMQGLDMWIFTPQVKKAVRISLQQKLTGDVANGDISRTRFAGDYKATLVGEDVAMQSYILDLVAIDKRVTYQHIRYWVSKKNSQPVQAQFFALNGKLMKTATFSDYKMIHGNSIMTKVVIQDALIAKNKSVLVYSMHKSETFSDSVFNKEQMDR